MRFGKAWVKYALLVVAVLALTTTIIPSGSSLAPMFGGCVSPTITESIATTVTTSTSPTPVAGLTAVSTLSSFQVTSSSSSPSCDLGTGENFLFILTLVTVAIILGVPVVIPEFPFGLFILAILTVLAYSIIRRRTRNLKT